MDTKNSKVFKILTLILCIAVIALTVSQISMTKRMADLAKPDEEAASETAGDIQYVLYLGTNDKDTTEPVLPPEEAKEAAKEILINSLGGYTIQEAEGGWIDGDKIYQEYTLVIYLSDTDIDTVHKVADELITRFNQSSVMIQSNQTTTEFYSGD